MHPRVHGETSSVPSLACARPRRSVTKKFLSLRVFPHCRLIVNRVRTTPDQGSGVYTGTSIAHLLFVVGRFRSALMNMPSSDAIIESLTMIANEWRMLAIVWHIGLGACAVALLAGWRPSNRVVAYVLVT